MPFSSRLKTMGDAVRQSLSTYRTALADRNVALLVGAGFISEIGDWFNIVALISLAYRYAETAEGVGGLLAVRMVARLLLQGPAGAFVDRHAGRKLLFASQLVMALVAASFLLLVRWPSLFLLYPLVIALEAANAVARPIPVAAPVISTEPTKIEMFEECRVKMSRYVFGLDDLIEAISSKSIPRRAWVEAIDLGMDSIRLTFRWSKDDGVAS